MFPFVGQTINLAANKRALCESAPVPRTCRGFLQRVWKQNVEQNKLFPS